MIGTAAAKKNQNKILVQVREMQEHIFFLSYVLAIINLYFNLLN